jgi:hypothetical protein
LFAVYSSLTLGILRIALINTIISDCKLQAKFALERGKLKLGMSRHQDKKLIGEALAKREVRLLDESGELMSEKASRI